MGTTKDPRTLSITKNLPPTTRSTMIMLLQEYRDVFTGSHEDMKGLDPKFYQHQINLSTDAKPVQQRWYRINPNYAARVKEEIEKILKIGFSPIVVVPKKNGKIKVCVDYRKLNVVTDTDAFPLPFTNSILDVRMHPDNQEKVAFITERAHSSATVLAGKAFWST